MSLFESFTLLQIYDTGYFLLHKTCSQKPNQQGCFVDVLFLFCFRIIKIYAVRKQNHYHVCWKPAYLASHTGMQNDGLLPPKLIFLKRNSMKRTTKLLYHTVICRRAADVMVAA